MQSPKIDLAVAAHHLVLIGGGEFSFGETRAIDEYLIANMPRDRRTVAFLPTASGSAEYATHIGNYFRQIDPSIETVNVPIYRGRDVRRQKSLNIILSAGMVYVGGGVAHNLIDTLRESAAELALRDAPLIAAIGAAATAFGVNGFGWLRDTVIDAPFEDERLRRLMSRPDARVGIGIPPKCALAIHADGTSEIVGEGTIAVFRKPSGR